MRLSLLLAIAASSAIAAVFDDDEYLGFAVIQVMVEGQREPVDRYVSVIKRDREYITDAYMSGDAVALRVYEFYPPSLQDVAQCHAYMKRTAHRIPVLKGPFQPLSEKEDLSREIGGFSCGAGVQLRVQG